MKTLIAEAIRGRQLVRLIYENRKRVTAAPLVLGQTADRKDAVLCCQIAPPMPAGMPWRLLYLDQISGLQRLDQGFDLTDLENRPLADQFSVVYATV